MNLIFDELMKVDVDGETARIHFYMPSCPQNLRDFWQQLGMIVASLYHPFSIETEGKFSRNATITVTIKECELVKFLQKMNMF